jgi:microcystin-dependent protein
MWSGAENQIPDGWALCNGNTVNGKQTPDLRGRFVVGAGTGSGYSIGDKGGASQVTLTVAQMPAHSHGMITLWSQPDWGRGDGAWPVWTGDRNVQTAEAGGDQPHENRPPYYALCYIMRVK